MGGSTPPPLGLGLDDIVAISAASSDSMDSTYLSLYNCKKSTHLSYEIIAHLNSNSVAT